MSADKSRVEICAYCKQEIFVDVDYCQACGGSGEDESEADGICNAFGCRGGAVKRYRCGCEEVLGEDEE